MRVRLVVGAWLLCADIARAWAPAPAPVSVRARPDLTRASAVAPPAMEGPWVDLVALGGGAPLPTLDGLRFDGPLARGPLPEAAFEVKEVRKDDVGECATLLVASFFEVQARHPTFLAVTAHRERRRLAAHHGCTPTHGHEMILIRSSRTGEAIAYADVDARPKVGGPHADWAFPRPYLSDLAVRPDFRRRGLARRLVAECERRAASWGHEALYLKVEAANDAALAMYAGLGYARVHEDDSAKKRSTLMKALIPPG